MSIRDFHAQLVSGNNKNNLLIALRKLTQVGDPKNVFAEEPLEEWAYWTDLSAEPRRQSLSTNLA